MTKYVMMFSVMVVLSAVYPVTSAHATDGGENERTPHYLSSKPENTGQAAAQFRQGVEKIEKVIQKDTLAGADLELIHEVTYSLEAALKELKKQYADSQEFAALKEAVEKVHLASESHQEKETRHGFASVQQLSQMIFIK